jgi:hypothetical protein
MAVYYRTLHTTNRLARCTDYSIHQHERTVRCCPTYRIKDLELDTTEWLITERPFTASPLKALTHTALDTTQRYTVDLTVVVLVCMYTCA